MRSGPELYAWLAGIAPRERDAAVERALGVDIRVSTAPPDLHLVGHHMMGVAALVRALHEIPVRADDRVLDLGAGLGKLALLTHHLTGASVRGIEVQEDLVARAPSHPAVRIERGDVRTASLEGASVIFLYCPFEGPVLEEVSRRLDLLEDVVVCSLGVDLRCRRLRPRASDSFWSAIWDSGSPRVALPLEGDARRVALEI